MAVETPLECSSCFTYILNTTDSARYEINEISGGAGDMTPCLMGGTAGVTGEGVRFPDVLSTDDAFGDVGTPKSSLKLRFYLT